MKCWYRFFIGLVFLTRASYANTIQVGNPALKVVLSGDTGALVSGGKWDSNMIRGKVYTVFYVDPDVGEMNDKAIQTLKKERFPEDKYGAIAIINMAATWLPNFAIESKLKKRQEEFPETIYVKDFKKALVAKWGLQDDSYAIMVFDHTGILRYKYEGKLSDSQIEAMVRTVKSSLAKMWLKACHHLYQAYPLGR